MLTVISVYSKGMHWVEPDKTARGGDGRDGVTPVCIAFERLTKN